MIESWAIYNTASGFIMCWGRNLDRISDQVDIDSGGTSSTLYLINNIIAGGVDLSCRYGNNEDVTNIDQTCMQVYDGDICMMDIDDLKIVCKEHSNKDILAYHTINNQIKSLVIDIGSSIPDSSRILNAITENIGYLEIGKATIDVEINGLLTQRVALDYLRDKSWRLNIPGPINWEQM